MKKSISNIFPRAIAGALAISEALLHPYALTITALCSRVRLGEMREAYAELW